MELICVDRRGLRRVNNREAAALIFTFGTSVGKFLVDKIRVQYDWDVIRKGYKGYKPWFPNKTEIEMRPDYNPENLRWLGVFIHEATHIWQSNTWHNIGVDWTLGKQNYDYDQYQLRAVKLKLEPFASAVQDWFYVKYGAESCLIGKKKQVSLGWVRERILEVYGHDPDTSPKYGLSWLEDRVDLDYRNLLRKIRNPDPPRAKLVYDADFTIQPPANSTKFRRVNNREAMALVYTFGGQVGNYLIRRIEIGEGTSDNVIHGQMYLPATHDPKSLKSLGDFIHKAVRIWQETTRIHTKNVGGENYNSTQLQSLNLTSRQHSKAVQDWFKLKYYYDYCRTRRKPHLMSWDEAVDPIVKAMGFDLNNNFPGMTAVLQFVEHHYARLIEEIREPSQLSRNRLQLSIPTFVPGA